MTANSLTKTALRYLCRMAGMCLLSVITAMCMKRLDLEGVIALPGLPYELNVRRTDRQTGNGDHLQLQELLETARKEKKAVEKRLQTVVSNFADERNRLKTLIQEGAKTISRLELNTPPRMVHLNGPHGAR